MAVTDTPAGDLVPLADRIRWMLLFRAAVTALLPVAAALHVLPGPALGRAFLIGLAWLALTLLTLPARHLGRTTAITAFTATLFGDGLLLGALRASGGWLGGPVELLVVVHVVAVTLLVSFRTGAKITFWHVLVCFLLLESRAAGLIGPAVEIELNRFLTTVGELWLIMLATASSAAVNERELRRRRYDAERLHTFGKAVARCVEPDDVLAKLATFGRDELLARRVAVLLDQTGTAYVLDAAGGRQTTLPAELNRCSAPHRAMDMGRTVLTGSRAAGADPLLNALMPGARALITVPFDTGEFTGVLILEHSRRSSQRASRRVELRMINTAEQAAGLAALATGRALLLARARESAQTDGLTGLANRRGFDERLIAEATRQPVTLIMIDLDHFKMLNDTHGHQAGDDVLQLVARVLAETAPAGALPARYGGEELALILPATDLADGITIAERIRSAIANAGGPVPVTASIGVASASESSGTPQELLTAADNALYQAKRGGRNRVAWLSVEAHAA